MQSVASWYTITIKASANGLAFLFAFATTVVNSMVIGHANVDKDAQVGMLAGFGLALAIQNGLHNGPAVGLVCAFDTLVTQAAGAGDFRRCAFYLGQGRAIMTLHWALLAPLVWYSEPLMISIGLDPKAAVYASRFNRINFFGWFFRTQMYAVCRFLSNLNHPHPNFWATGTSLIVHLCLLFACGLNNISLEGLAWVTVASTGFNALVVILYTVVNAPILNLERRWLFAMFFVFRDWGVFIRLSMMGVVQSCAESWALEAFTFMSGFLNETALAACSLNNTIRKLGYLCGASVGVAASGLVGEVVGKQQPWAAKRTADRCWAFAVFLWLPCGLLLFFGAPWFSAAFTPQPSVQEYLTPLVRLYSLAFLGDCLNQVATRIMRALNRPRTAAVAYPLLYCLMLPLAFVLAFPRGLQVMGMFYAYTITAFALVCIMAVTYRRTSMDAVVRECQERLKDTIEMGSRTSSMISIDHIAA